jgi:hypothetical protein
LGEGVSAAPFEEWRHREVESVLGGESTATEEPRPWSPEDTRLVGHVDGACPQPRLLRRADHKSCLNWVGQRIDDLVPGVRAIDEFEEAQALRGPKRLPAPEGGVECTRAETVDVSGELWDAFMRVGHDSALKNRPSLLGRGFFGPWVGFGFQIVPGPRLLFQTRDQPSLEWPKRAKVMTQKRFV